jgi:hypothetical protein
VALLNKTKSLEHFAAWFADRLKDAPHGVAIDLWWQSGDIISKRIFEGTSGAIQRAVGHPSMYQMVSVVSKRGALSLLQAQHLPG